MRKLVKLVLPLVFVVVLFFGIKTLTDKKPQLGDKDITINVKVKNEDETLKEIKQVHTKTDATTVGEVLDEIDDKFLDIELEGDKTSEFGRFIISIESYKTEDMTKGPWWMIYSDTNKDCLEAGYCSGIDSQNIYDEDIFDLVFE